MKEPERVCIPPGITQVVWKNKTKGKGRQVTLCVRIRISKKVHGSPFKVDRLFDTLEEPKEFLASCQSNIGPQALSKIEPDRDGKTKHIADLPGVEHQHPDVLRIARQV